MIEWTSTGPIYTGVGGVDPMFMPGYVAPGFRINPMTGMAPIPQMHQQAYQQAQMRNQPQPIISNRREPWTGNLVPQGTQRPPILPGPQQRPMPGMNQPAPFPQQQTSVSQTVMPPRVTNLGPISDIDLNRMLNFIPTDPMNYQSNTPFGPFIPMPIPETMPTSQTIPAGMQKIRRKSWSDMLKPPPGSWEEKVLR